MQGRLLRAGRQLIVLVGVSNEYLDLPLIPLRRMTSNLFSEMRLLQHLLLALLIMILLIIESTFFEPPNKVSVLSPYRRRAASLLRSFTVASRLLRPSDYPYSKPLFIDSVSLSFQSSLRTLSDSEKVASFLWCSLRLPSRKKVADFRERFEALSAPLSHLSDEVLESTFLNGLDPEIKAEVLSYEPVGLGQIMRAALWIEDKQMVTRSRLGQTKPIKAASQTLNCRQGRQMSDPLYYTKSIPTGIVVKVKSSLYYDDEMWEGEDELSEVPAPDVEEVTDVAELDLNTVTPCGGESSSFTEELRSHHGKRKGPAKGFLRTTWSPWKVIKEDRLPLPLGGVDLILGMQWRRTLGVTEVDWKNFTLTIGVGEERYSGGPKEKRGFAKILAEKKGGRRISGMNKSFGRSIRR
ncbi:gypsy/ty3 element polyprotein [Cucumis melo var. makuwa]|uniref:Gypsy/ty3 element polyprotein n=1 Tax=Cucumis melo var. makuwa TaxID=1194695 RepID=A0A5A7SLB5_CUCMM|nr:gypsy/ty3 element polyprotein [Cucumis melo var. makuwa]